MQCVMFILLSLSLMYLIASWFDAGNRTAKSGNIGSNTSNKGSYSENTSYNATDEEKKLNQSYAKQQQELAPAITDMSKRALSLVSSILSGNDMPGYYSGLGEGISPEVTQNLVDQSLADVAASAQYSGILDSGTAGELATRAATDVRNSSEQYNQQLLLNLIQTALGGVTSSVQPAENFGQILASNLQGLRDTATSGKQRSNSRTWNYGISFCWVAKEIFGSWEHQKTQTVRYYIKNIAPKWFSNFYGAYGERIADYISDKPIFKLALRPLFEAFAFIGKRAMNKEGICLSY